MLKGFKDFLMRGNVVELAVAVVIGSAFTNIVTAFTKNIINPLIASLGGSPEVGGLGVELRSGNHATFVDFGSVITAAINFLIIAAVVYFILIMPMNKLAELNARRKGITKTEAAATETELLAEIRDLLLEQQGVNTANTHETGINELNDNTTVDGQTAGSTSATSATAQSQSTAPSTGRHSK